MTWKINFYNQTVKDDLRELHVFIKKTDATPKKEMELGIKRMKEVKKHDI